jgi:predicted DNA-binding antitoxin AbrB/MazE fold protein
MKQAFEAIYENGMLRPLEPLDLPEQERVSVTVESNSDEEWLDHDAVAWAMQEGDPALNLDDVRARLAKIAGSLSDVVIAERGDY